MLAKARIINLEELRDGYFNLLLLEEGIAREAVPGQFLHIRIGDGLKPFLRRPFSLAGVSAGEGTLQIIFRVVGAGTKALSMIAKGRELDCLGPLGNGFRVSKRTGPAVLLAGGIGVAPLLYLAEVLAGERQVFLFYGAASRNELLPVKRFLPEGVQVTFVTEDGSAGSRGLLTEAFEEALKKGLVPADLFACGPEAMLRSIAKKGREWGYPLQVSLEERMACGIGACQGCVVGVGDGSDLRYERVCKEGPVFNDKEVAWDAS
jgi:dihydroorotate dehydrogenase electron transfer subunit